MRNDQSAMPLLVALFGMALFTAMDAVVKGLTPHFPTFQIVCLRFLFTTPWIALVLLVQRPAWPRRDRIRAHAIRGALMVATAGCFFYALGQLPLAELFAISLTSPLFIAIFGALFLRERLRPIVLVALAIGFAGVLVIMREGFGGLSTLPLLAVGAAILAPITYAAGIVLLRSQTAHEPLAIIVFVQSAFVALFTAPVALIGFVMPDGEMWLRFLALGLLGTVGNLCFAYALSRMPAARFSVVEYTGLLWAALLGYVFFAEVPRLAVWLGAGLIVAACLLVLRDKQAAT